MIADVSLSGLSIELISKLVNPAKKFESPKSLLDMHFEISETLFWTVMASIIVVAVLRSLSKKSRLDPEFVETMRDLSKMDQSIDEAANDAVDSIGDAMRPEG